MMTATVVDGWNDDCDCCVDGWNDDCDCCADGSNSDSNYCTCTSMYTCMTGRFGHKLGNQNESQLGLH